MVVVVVLVVVVGDCVVVVVEVDVVVWVDHVIDVSALLLEVADDSCGAATVFLGCVRNVNDGKTVTGRGSDTDTLVASARAYVSALNKLLAREARRKPETMLAS